MATTTASSDNRTRDVAPQYGRGGIRAGLIRPVSPKTVALESSAQRLRGPAVDRGIDVASADEVGVNASVAKPKTGGAVGSAEYINRIKKSTDKLTSKMVRPSAPVSSGRGGKAWSALEKRARTQLGVRYVWGGTTPGKGFDCSGFTQWVFRGLGVNLPRVSRSQARVGRSVGRNLKNAKPGDLVFYAKGGRVYHVGIYAGNGRWYVAPRTGDVVKLQTIRGPIYDIRRVL